MRSTTGAAPASRISLRSRLQSSRDGVSSGGRDEVGCAAHPAADPIASRIREDGRPSHCHRRGRRASPFRLPTSGRSDHRLRRRRAGGVRALLPIVFDLPRTPGTLPRGHLRQAGMAKAGPRPDAARAPGANRGRAGLRPDGMVGPELERDGAARLPRRGREAHERLDRLSSQRRCTSRSGGAGQGTEANGSSR